MQVQNIQAFITSTAVIGILCSLAIEALTRLLATKPLASKFVSVTFCIVVATLYYFASQAPWWPTFLVILSMASLVYALFFNSNGTNTTTPTNFQG